MPRQVHSEGGGEQTLTVSGVMGHHVGRALYIVPSAVAWVLLPLIGYGLHRAWPGVLPSATVFLAGCAVAATEVCTNHRRGFIATVLPPALILTLVAWVATACLAGLHSWLIFIWAVFGISAMWSWNIHGHRTRTRPKDDTGSSGDISHLFAADAQVAGLKGLKVLKAEIGPHMAEGEGLMPAGQMTAQDLARQTKLIESAASVSGQGGLPPGALQIRAHEGGARKFRWTLSDPNVLNKPMPWPGPSNPGGSIAEPLVIGRWQSSEPLEYKITGHHLQGMGATGAGKTMGLMYNEIAETVTRYDAAVVAMDVTKRLQFVGPLEPCLHIMAIEDAHVIDVLNRLHRARLARTDWLGGLRLSKWEKGCGLTHVTVYLAEVPDIWTLVDKSDLDEGDMMDMLLSDVKADRSAGIRLVFDLQRSDWTQQPTLARGQLAKMCFGVLDEGDAAFGLSAAQQKAECSPETWGVRYPGKLFLDAPTINEKFITMPGRAWYWGEDSSLIAAHAEAYPASKRPMDHITSPILMGTPGQRLPVTVTPPAGWTDPTAGGVLLDRQPTGGTVWESRPAPVQPDRETVRLHSVPDKEQNVDDGGEEVQDVREDELENGQVRDDVVPVEVPEAMRGVRLGPPEVPEGSRLTPAAARSVFRTQLREWLASGKSRFSIEALLDADVEEHATRSRPWLYTEVQAAVDEGMVRSLSGYPEQWEILRAA
jgi:hypothetical protein